MLWWKPVSCLAEAHHRSVAIFWQNSWTLQHAFSSKLPAGGGDEGNADSLGDSDLTPTEGSPDLAPVETEPTVPAPTVPEPESISEAKASDDPSQIEGSFKVQSYKYPRRIEFYHRRHREIKKFEKQQDRIHSLRSIAEERREKGDHAMAQAAADEADRLEAPRLSVNLPVKPPPYASVSAGRTTPPKVAVYSEANRPQKQLDLKAATKKLDVLNLKVGYAIDAQYALPDEVKAFVLDQTTFCLYGVDKNQVTQIAANIRRIRPPEPYKGAGIRIVGESVKLKERKVK